MGFLDIYEWPKILVRRTPSPPVGRPFLPVTGKGPKTPRFPAILRQNGTTETVAGLKSSLPSPFSDAIAIGNVLRFGPGCALDLIVAALKMVTLPIKDAKKIQRTLIHFDESQSYAREEL